MNRPFLDFLKELERKRVNLFYDAGIVLNSTVIQVKAGGLDFETAFKSLCTNLNEFNYPYFPCYDVIERDFYRFYLVEKGWNKEHFRKLLNDRVNGLY